LSQRELASALGISQKWVREIKQGKPGILMDRLFKIFEATGITLYAKFEVKNWDADEQGDSLKGKPAHKQARLLSN